MSELPAELTDHLAAQAAEYGKYRATRIILHDGATAYLPGQPVPVSNVVQYGYLLDGSVCEVDAPPPPPDVVVAP